MMRFGESCGSVYEQKVSGGLHLKRAQFSQIFFERS